MNKRRGKILFVCIPFVLSVGISFASDSSNSDPNEAQLILLTDVQAGIGVAGASGDDYDLKTSRQVQFDILRLDKWFMHFDIEEISLFDPSPSQMDHTIQYFSAGWQTDTGRYSFFWDHTCNNPTRNFPEGQSNVIRWNELGVGYETLGMRLGHENDGIDFDSSLQWLNKIDWGISLSRDAPSRLINAPGTPCPVQSATAITRDSPESVHQ